MTGIGCRNALHTQLTAAELLLSCASDGSTAGVAQCLPALITLDDEPALHDERGNVAGSLASSTESEVLTAHIRETCAAADVQAAPSLASPTPGGMASSFDSDGGAYLPLPGTPASCHEGPRVSLLTPAASPAATVAVGPPAPRADHQRAPRVHRSWSPSQAATGGGGGNGVVGEPAVSVSLDNGAGLSRGGLNKPHGRCPLPLNAAHARRRSAAASSSSASSCASSEGGGGGGCPSSASPQWAPTEPDDISTTAVGAALCGGGPLVEDAVDATQSRAKNVAAVREEEARAALEELEARHEALRLWTAQRGAALEAQLADSRAVAEAAEAAASAAAAATQRAIADREAAEAAAATVAADARRQSERIQAAEAAAAAATTQLAMEQAASEAARAEVTVLRAAAAEAEAVRRQELQEQVATLELTRHEMVSLRQQLANQRDQAPSSANAGEADARLVAAVAEVAALRKQLEEALRADASATDVTVTALRGQLAQAAEQVCGRRCCTVSTCSEVCPWSIGSVCMHTTAQR
jgi:hypothetical protein